MNEWTSERTKRRKITIKRIGSTECCFCLICVVWAWRTMFIFISLRSLGVRSSKTLSAPKHRVLVRSFAWALMNTFRAVHVVSWRRFKLQLHANNKCWCRLVLRSKTAACVRASVCQCRHFVIHTHWIRHGALSPDNYNSAVAAMQLARIRFLPWLNVDDFCHSLCCLILCRHRRRHRKAFSTSLFSAFASSLFGPPSLRVAHTSVRDF